MPALRDVVASLSQGCSGPREVAVRLHDFVRDIPFGFTPLFDGASPDATLALGRGHCIPKGSLFVAMLSLAGVPARQHAVNIPADILRGCFPSEQAQPPAVTHTYTEVQLDGRWLRVDSYVVDPQLHAAAVAQLRKEGRTAGYGVHMDGTSTWDGMQDAFVQFVDPGRMTLQDLGTVDDVLALQRDARYLNRVGPLPISSWLAPLRLAPKWAVRQLNSRTDQLRRQHVGTLAAGARAGA